MVRVTLGSGGLREFVISRLILNVPGDLYVWGVTGVYKERTFTVTNAVYNGYRLIKVSLTLGDLVTLPDCT